jgi:hypothetical protein
MNILSMESQRVVQNRTERAGQRGSESHFDRVLAFASILPYDLQLVFRF